MRIRVLLVVLALIVIGCGAGDDHNPVAPAPVATATPASTPPTSTVVRLTIAAYNDSGDLLDSWPRTATVTIEAVPACAQPSANRAPARLSDLRRTYTLSTGCRPPAYVDWDLSGAACELRGDRNAPSVRVQCTTAGELRADAVSRDSRGGPEVGRGSAQFRILP